VPAGGDGRRGWEGDTMIYEIVNPSDAYTLETGNYVAACIATLALGNGKYGLTAIGGTEDEGMPIFFFSDPDKWLTEKFGKDFNGLLSEIPPNELADVFDSVIIGDANTRKDYLEALALIDDETKKAMWRESWHDRRRSSMNDIGGRARRLAEGLRRSVNFAEVTE
jgi:hypothetical protein